MERILADRGAKDGKKQTDWVQRGPKKKKRIRKKKHKDKEKKPEGVVNRQGAGGVITVQEKASKTKSGGAGRVEAGEGKRQGETKRRRSNLHVSKKSRALRREAATTDVGLKHDKRRKA